MGSSQQLPISDQIFDDLSPVYDDSVKLRVNSNHLKTVIARIFDLKNILKTPLFLSTSSLLFEA